MGVFTQVQLRRQELISKGFPVNKLVMVTNAVTILAVLQETVHDKELIKNYKQTRTFYGMDVVIIKGDNFDHNRHIHFEIFEQLNKN